ncbi:dihydropyrimidinase [Diplocloster modestus]|uniref:Dihydropyrimidinase n=1 Tax=Diplocloster modestus TaxID=2850322 RepID=A0ABS6K8V7_9FIRM|nr:dihydropyrimidinase [Diplocloster modestus]MBU9726953.1 dihydropyrimidinase [Diplocloster modestus]
MAVIIKNGTVVSPTQSAMQDIRIEGEKIAQVGENLPVSAEDTVYDAQGKLVFPGFIDAHTHMDMDNGKIVTADDFASGGRAAIAGGTTLLIDFATQDKGHLMGEAFYQWMAKAEQKCSCDYAFHMAIIDWNEETRQELTNMFRIGVSSFKVYLAYDNLRINDRELYELLCDMKKLGGIVGVHCENGDLVNELVAEQLAAGNTSPAAHPASRPAEVEAEAISRLLYIAKLADCPVHIVHLSTKLGLEEIRKARANGQTVYVETCPQYLLMDDCVYSQPDFEGAKYVCSPPVRKKEDQEALWEGLINGEIQTVATDHCSYNFHGQKDLGIDDFSKIPNGLPGIEHRPELIYTYGVKTGRITKEKMCEILTANNAKIFGCYPQKGVIAPGSDADIVIWQDCQEPITAAAQHHNVDYTPYEGIEILGKPQTVFLRGQEVFRDGKLLQPELGIYISREPGGL